VNGSACLSFPCYHSHLFPGKGPLYPLCGSLPLSPPASPALFSAVGTPSSLPCCLCCFCEICEPTLPIGLLSSSLGYVLSLLSRFPLNPACRRGEPYLSNLSRWCSIPARNYPARITIDTIHTCDIQGSKESRYTGGSDYEQQQVAHLPSIDAPLANRAVLSIELDCSMKTPVEST
jgi:hypothetical protein